jgi:lipoprotein-releasing system permease protein
MVPSASQFTPMGRISSQRIFTVIGVFSAPGDSDVNGFQMLVNQQAAFAFASS